MNRCRSCLTKAAPENGTCPICGIQQDKKKSALSPDEKNVRHFARCILGVSVLHLAGLVLCLYVLLVYNPEAAATGGFTFSPAIVMGLSILNLILAYGLSRYAYWAYRVAVAYYFLLGIVNIVSVQLLGVLIVLILLYFIGNSTARSIFERRRV